MMVSTVYREMFLDKSLVRNYRTCLTPSQTSLPLKQETKTRPFLGRGKARWIPKPVVMEAEEKASDKIFEIQPKTIWHKIHAAVVH